MAPNPVRFSRCIDQVLWTARGIGSSSTSICSDGHLDYHRLPGLILQGFIALWSGAAVGPEGTLVFLIGGFGSLVSERLKLQKDDVQVLVYNAIAGGFFGSPILGAVGACTIGHDI